MCLTYGDHGRLEGETERSKLLDRDLQQANKRLGAAQANLQMRSADGKTLQEVEAERDTARGEIVELRQLLKVAEDQANKAEREADRRIKEVEDAAQADGVVRSAAAAAAMPLSPLDDGTVTSSITKCLFGLSGTETAFKAPLSLSTMYAGRQDGGGRGHDNKDRRGNDGRRNGGGPPGDGR